MELTAWNNGKHHESGAGYGLKLSKEDRDRYFEKTWKVVYLSLPGTEEEIEINIAKPSFWNDTCRELINKEIGKWLINSGFAPWPAGSPPKFIVNPIQKNHFKLES